MLTTIAIFKYVLGSWVFIKYTNNIINIFPPFPFIRHSLAWRSISLFTFWLYMHVCLIRENRGTICDFLGCLKIYQYDDKMEDYGIYMLFEV